MSNRSWAFFLISVVSISCFAKQYPRYDYTLETYLRGGLHLNNPSDLSSGRIGLGYVQNFILSNWMKISFGGLGEYEAVYSIYPSKYSTDIKSNDSLTFFPRDNYIRLSAGGWRLTTGWQQVVWGETFGNNISDIINPKDLRELGLEKPSRQRLNVPLINLQWLDTKTSLQALYIPFPQFNLVPQITSDFSFNYNSYFPGATILQRAGDSNPPSRGEFGGRISHQFSNLNAAAFYFDYFDRLPVYQLQVNSASPLVIQLNPNHSPLRTAGASLTYDWNSTLLRGEVAYNFNREFNTLTSSVLSTQLTDEMNYIFGIDFNSFGKWVPAIQFSESLLALDATYLLRQKRQSRFDLRIARNFSGDRSLEFLGSYYTMDGSGLYQVKYSHPLSGKWELDFGVDWFEGLSTSQWGQFRRASRFLITFRGFFS